MGYVLACIFDGCDGALPVRLPHQAVSCLEKQVHRKANDISIATSSSNMENGFAGSLNLPQEIRHFQHVPFQKGCQAWAAPRRHDVMLCRISTLHGAGDLPSGVTLYQFGREQIGTECLGSRCLQAPCLYDDRREPCGAGTLFQPSD